MRNASDEYTQQSTSAPIDRDGKAWEPPKLEKHGDIRTMTGGPEGGTIDSLFGGVGGFEAGS